MNYKFKLFSDIQSDSDTQGVTKMLGHAIRVSFPHQKKSYMYTGLFEMIVGVLTTCHTQYT